MKNEKSQDIINNDPSLTKKFGFIDILSISIVTIFVCILLILIMTLFKK